MQNQDRKNQRREKIIKWLPFGLGKEELERKRSILWSDSTLFQDVELLKFLTIRNLSYSNFRDEYLDGLERMFRNICSSSWNEKYPAKSFIFCDYYAKQIKIADITTVLYAQAVEILVISLQLNAGSDFGEKFKHLFRNIYQDEPKVGISKLVRIMRNNAAHLAQVDSQLNLENNLKQEDKELVDEWAVKYYQGNITSMFHSLSAAFDHVVEDMIFRCLDADIDQERKYHLSGYMMFSNQFDLN